MYGRRAPMLATTCASPGVWQGAGVRLSCNWLVNTTVCSDQIFLAWYNFQPGVQEHVFFLCTMADLLRFSTHSCLCMLTFVHAWLRMPASQRCAHRVRPLSSSSSS